MSNRVERWKQFLKFLDPYRGVLALLAVFILGIAASPYDLAGRNVFLKSDVQWALLRMVAEYGILAAGMTLVILTGGIDLSVGSVLGMSGMVFSHLLIVAEWSAPAALAVGVLAGGAMGAVNGVLISRFGMQPFVATLASMVAARGLAKWVSDSKKIMTELELLPNGVAVRKVPEMFEVLGGRVGSSPVFVVTLIMVSVMVLGWWLLRKTMYGRSLYAIGGNEEAAKLSGLRVALNKTIAYALCGGLAGLAGVLHACQAKQGDPDAGSMYELDAIAAVVIGGTTLTGGRGGMILTLIGVLIIGYIDTVLGINNVQYPKRLVIKGTIIVIAVLIQQRRRH